VEILLQGAPAHYLTRVLRVVPGQSVVLFNGDGCDYASEIVRPGKKDVLTRVLGRVPARPESPLRITLVQALSLGEWLGLDRPGPRLVLEPGADSALTRISLEDKVALLVGPEGGFSDSELALMRLHDVQAARLGPRILCIETAGPAAIAILQALAGDFR
jgi:16S rRNA U1498 N3-methylase RsmE